MCIMMPGCIYCCFHKVAIARYYLSLDELDEDKVKAQIPFTARGFSRYRPIHNAKKQPTTELYRSSDDRLAIVSLKEYSEEALGESINCLATEVLRYLLNKECRV
jgi:hypothetical protein